MKKLLLALFCALALGACGGGDDGNGNGGDDDNDVDTQAFIDRVTEIIATSDDTADPVDIDGITADTTETGDPVAVSIP